MYNCIQKFPAVGWVRGNSTDSMDYIEHRIEEYMEKHTIADEEINALFGRDSFFGKKIEIQTSSNVYVNHAVRGSFTFDYSNNNGEFVIGKDDYEFVTKWSKASDISIHASKEGHGIDAIARIKGPVDLQGELSGEYDFSSRTRTPIIGDVIIWRNKRGKYAATKIVAISDDTRGTEHDELTCEFVIYA